MTRITTIDLYILFVYLAATYMVGFWVSRGQRTLSDYLLGARNLPWWAVLFSIVATESSIVTFLSVPGLVSRIDGVSETGDFRFLQLPIGFILGRYLVAWILLPAYFRGELFTAYQVLGERFGGHVKRLASLIFVVARTLADGLRLLLASLPISTIFNWPLPVTIAGVGAAAIVYTYFGGVKAVVWTECAQFAVKIAGAAAVGLAAVNAVGGWSEVHRFAEENDAYRIFYFSFDHTLKYTFWTGVVGGAFLSLGSHGVDQMMVQRYLCAGSLRSARRALVLSGWVVLALFAFVLLVGLAVACYYSRMPPTTPFTKNDEVFVAFFANSGRLPIGFLGLMLAAVLAAAMSTLSSSLNASAGAVAADWLIPMMRWSADSPIVFRVTRWLTLLFGVLQIAVAVSFQNVPSVVGRGLDIAGYTTGVLLGLYFLGIFTKAGQRSALVGLVGTVAVTLPLKFTTSLAWPWYAPICSLGLMALGYLTEYFFPSKHRHEGEKDVDP